MASTFFFFNDTATTEIYTLSLHDALPISIVIAWVAHNAIPGLPWASAFALGAVVSPPDVAAATAFLRRLPMPRRVVRSEEHTSELQSPVHPVFRLLP